MKNKQPPVIYRIVSRGQKSPSSPHNSGSTIQASENKIISNKIAQIVNTQNICSNKNAKSPESHTISALRSQLRSIKSSQGLVKPLSAAQWLESSQNISSFSKTSGGGSSAKPNNSKSPQHICTGSDESQNRHRSELDQFQNLKRDYERLKMMYQLKQQKEADAAIKNRKLSQQVAALRKNKQELVKCIQILQSSIREANQELKCHINASKILEENNKQIEEKLAKTISQKLAKQKEIVSINKVLQRLQQEISYRKAENNQLINIIELKQQEVHLLRAKHIEQLKILESQYKNQYQLLRNSRISESRHQVRRASSNDKTQQFVRKAQLQRLTKEVSILNVQLQNRQNVMNMMLKDIRSMDKELKQYDLEHQDFLRLKVLVSNLNEIITKFELKRLSNKYKYF